MDKLKNIKLGAPDTIIGGASHNAELSVQTMMRCRELTLTEGATKEGSIATAARLLAQLREELQPSTSLVLRVGFVDVDAATAWFRPTYDPATDGSMWQAGDEVTVSGLRLFIVRGKEMEAYLMAHPQEGSAQEEVVNDWLEEVCESMVDEGDYPVKDEFVFWSCSDGKEGSWANVLPDGTVKGKYFMGSVRGALRANPQMAFGDMWLALGLGNCTSEEWTEGKKLLAAKSHLKEVLDDPEMAEQVSEVIAERPSIIAEMEEYGVPFVNFAKSYAKYGDVVLKGVLGINYLNVTNSTTGCDLGVKATNSTTYTVKFYNNNARDTHLLGACKTLGNTNDIFLLQSYDGEKVSIVSKKSSDIFPFETYRNLWAVNKVVIDNYNPFTGRFYYIIAVKDSVCTHFWIPYTNGRFLDIIEDKQTSWSATFVQGN